MEIKLFMSGTFLGLLMFFIGLFGLLHFSDCETYRFRYWFLVIFGIVVAVLSIIIGLIFIL